MIRAIDNVVARSTQEVRCDRAYEVRIDGQTRRLDALPAASQTRERGDRRVLSCSSWISTCTIVRDLQQKLADSSCNWIEM